MNQLARNILVAGTLLLMAACGGGGGSDSTTTATTTTTTAATGTVTGKVVDNSTGAAVTGATVSVGSLSATTAADGTYTIANVPVGDDQPISFSKGTYAAGSKIASVTSGATTRSDIALLPVTYTTTFAPSAAQTLAVPGSPAQVTLGANALVTASGGAPSGNVTANITPVDPTSNPQIMPGNYTTSTGDNMESFGAMEVSFTDASGAPLNLATGQSSTIRIPVAAGTTSPAATMPAFYYNAATGKWVQEGTLTLAGTAPNQYYTGTVTHFSYWNADKVLETTCLTGKVVDAAGAAVSGARVEAQGQGYIGTSTAYTSSAGTFTIKVKSNASVILTASTSTAQSQSLVVSTSAAGTACTALTSDLTLGSGTATAGSAKIKLTWGTNPSDLDSHLTGPDGVVANGRFHVYYSSKGSLTGNPNAALDVDDISSFGPEIITITQFRTGTYKYSVHHYSGSGTIISSPARVELTLNGSTRVFTPPASATTLVSKSVWEVFNLVVAADGSVTVNTLGTYLPATDAAAVPKQSAGFDEYYLFSNLPKK